MASFALALGVALWKPISPRVYALTLACASFLLIAPVVILAGGNLIGMIVLSGACIVALVSMIACAISFTAPPLRALGPRPSVAVAITGFGAITLLTADLRQLKLGSDESLSILDHIEEIRRAELSYADSSDAHAFTCNGPDLPGLGNISWSSDPLGGYDLNRAHIDGQWVYLGCADAWHPQSLNIQVLSPGGQPLFIAVTR